MKSMDETVKEFEDLAQDSKCMYCPYDAEDEGDLVCTRGSCIYTDTLFFLKEYQCNLKNLQTQFDEYSKSKKEYEDAYIAIHSTDNSDGNPAVTWDELKEMTGKPVWIQHRFHGEWVIVDRFDYLSSNDRNRPAMYVKEHMRYYPYQTMGYAWNAYRKEII